jgi:DNA ligase (NAD+)
VIVGADPGSKFEKAKELGVKILNEQEFLALVGEKS